MLPVAVGLVIGWSAPTGGAVLECAAVRRLPRRPLVYAAVVLDVTVVGLLAMVIPVRRALGSAH